MGTSKRYSEEVRERAVRMVAEHLHEYSSRWAAITSIAAKIGCTAESLRRWVHGSERDSGLTASCDHVRHDRVIGRVPIRRAE
jgi:transposase-like protein